MTRRETGFHVDFERLSSLLAGRSGEPYAAPLRRGDLSIGLYGPGGRDEQEPHTLDEVYIIAAGEGTCRCGDTRTAFKPGDALFVPAQVRHKFEDVSDDFLVWVIFLGPAGGDEPAFYEVDSNLVTELD